MIGNKIADKIIKVSRTWTFRNMNFKNFKNFTNSETVTNLEEKDMSPQQEWKTIDDLRIMEQ